MIAFLKVEPRKNSPYDYSQVLELLRYNEAFEEVRPWDEYTQSENHTPVIWLHHCKDENLLPDNEARGIVSKGGEIAYGWQCSTCKGILMHFSDPWDHNNDYSFNYTCCGCHDTWDFPQQIETKEGA